MIDGILQFPFNQSCLVCGNQNCTESYDHQKVTLEKLQSMLENYRFEDQERVKTINQVHEFYDCFLNDIVNQIQKDRQTTLQTLMELDYQFLKSNSQISMKLVGELSCQNYSSLPSKRLIPIIQTFEKSPVRSFVRERQNQIQSVISEYITVDNFRQKIIDFKETLLAPILNLEKQVKYQKTRKVSMRQIQNPQIIETKDDDIQINIKGRIITQQSIQAQVNNRNVNDNDIVGSINELRKLKSLKKVEIRNNRITNLTCKVFAFNLPHLTKLDIRGNNLGDQGVLVIAKNLKSLTQLYICQNKVTDVVAEQIFKNLKDLTMLWMQNNRISLNAAIMIMTLQKLRAVALHGNLFSSDEGQCLKVNFLGYVNV